MKILKYLIQTTLIITIVSFTLDDPPSDPSTVRYGYIFTPYIFTSNGVYKVESDIDPSSKIESNVNFLTTQYSSNLLSDSNNYAMLYVQKPLNQNYQIAIFEMDLLPKFISIDVSDLNLEKNNVYYKSILSSKSVNLIRKK